MAPRRRKLLAWMWRLRLTYPPNANGDGMRAGRMELPPRLRAANAVGTSSSLQQDFIGISQSMGIVGGHANRTHDADDSGQRQARRDHRRERCVAGAAER